MNPTQTASRIVTRWRARSNAALANIRVVARDYKPQLRQNSWQKLFARPRLQGAV